MKKRILLQVSLLLLSQWCLAQSSISEFNRKDPVKLEKKEEDNRKSERTIMIYGNPIKMNELRVSGIDTNFLNSRLDQEALRELNDSISNIYQLLNSQAIESQKAINKKEKDIKEIIAINKKMQNSIKELQEKRDDLQRLVEKTNKIMLMQKDSLQRVQSKLIENRNAISTNFVGLARVRYFETAKDLEKQYTELKAKVDDIKKTFEKDSIVSKDDIKKKILKDTLLAVSKNIIKIDNFRDTLTLSIGNDTAIVNIRRMEGIRKTSNQLIQASYSKLDALYLLKSVSKVDDNDNITSLIETLPSIVATSAFFVPTVSLLGSFTKNFLLMFRYLEALLMPILPNLIIFEN
ncbi:hypothetical protein GCM10011514_40040 [Emticicia aquatilis]|uniref:Uncharacterized protein n=1 Tax=Emticicia aquatilis TaxID=1537369 RepID=A0A916Z1S4_9BACT|nr:hypothetical protein [Emticicia aquatilis]GGD71907.1 hypothetical protein GCM10011514_40040 [Emticicia aquatilis]